MKLLHTVCSHPRGQIKSSMLTPPRARDQHVNKQLPDCLVSVGCDVQGTP